jgi:hypothetical protein
MYGLDTIRKLNETTRATTETSGNAGILVDSIPCQCSSGSNATDQKHEKAERPGNQNKDHIGVSELTCVNDEVINKK